MCELFVRHILCQLKLSKINKEKLELVCFCGDRDLHVIDEHGRSLIWSVFVAWHSADKFLADIPCHVWLVTKKKRVEVLCQIMDVVSHILARFPLNLFMKEPEVH